MIWYIAGPMTGREDWNYPAFMAAEEWLRKAWPDAEIINPATQFGGDTTLPRQVYMRSALASVARCDRVYLLREWYSSAGACLEVMAAHEAGAEMWHEGDNEPCPDGGAAADYQVAVTYLNLRRLPA